MTCQYDTLLAELRRAETAERDTGEMRKARPAGELFGGFNRAMRRAAAMLDAASKSAPAFARRVDTTAPTAAGQREAFAKSLAALNLKIGEAAASGSLSALDVARLEARLHAMAERAAPHLRAAGQ